MFRMSRLFLAACVMGLLALAPVARAADVLMMATTTSTQDSGLLEYLEPFFKKETGMTPREYREKYHHAEDLLDC